ncbi:MAG TPA: hypothetical protein VN132_08730 [Bdellovibrio sp.]|nr:hypothetical protein [Bdellovibrio sp.]
MVVNKHFRRCHRCGSTHEIQFDSERYFEYECDCGLELIPFYYSYPGYELVGLFADWNEEAVEVDSPTN